MQSAFDIRQHLFRLVCLNVIEDELFVAFQFIVLVVERFRLAHGFPHILQAFRISAVTNEIATLHVVELHFQTRQIFIRGCLPQCREFFLQIFEHFLQSVTRNIHFLSRIRFLNAQDREQFVREIEVVIEHFQFKLNALNRLLRAGIVIDQFRIEIQRRLSLQRLF